MTKDYVSADRIKSVPRPQYFCNWGDWSTNDHRTKCFCAWRDRKFLLLARPKRKVPPTEIFPQLARAKHKWPPIEAFFVPGVTESFCDWRGRSTSVHQPKIFIVTGANEVYVTSDVKDAKKNADWKIFESDATESFCDWRDRSLSVRRTKQNCPPTTFILQLIWPKHEWPLTEIILRLTRPKLFATGETKVSDYRSFFGQGRAKYKWPPTEVFFATVVTEARLTADRSVFAPESTGFFCDWRDWSLRCEPGEVYLRLARTKQNLPPTEAICPPIAISCDWGNRSTIDHPYKNFRARRDRKFLRLAWRKHEFLCAQRKKDRRPNFFLRWARRKQKSAESNFFLQMKWPKQNLTLTEMFFASGATENFCDWRDIKTSVRQTKLIGD